MTARNPSMTEQKLVTLCALERLGPTTALQLLRFMVENELMDYIALQLAMAELDEMGLLRKIPHELGALYALSEEGFSTLRMFHKRIPHSRMRQIEAAAPAWKHRFREEKQVMADWSQDTMGEYTVRLRLLEGEMPLLDMSLSLPTREQAVTFCTNWPRRAGELYARLMHELGGASEEVEDGASV